MMRATQKCPYCFRWAGPDGRIPHTDDCIPGQEERARRDPPAAPFGCIGCPSLRAVAEELFETLCALSTREVHGLFMALPVKRVLDLAHSGREEELRERLFLARLTRALLAAAGGDRLPSVEALLAAVPEED